VVGCRSCELIARRDRGEAPRWDCLLRTSGWDVAHAYDSSLEGWTVLVLRRHVTTVAEMTAEEASQLGTLVKSVSSALAVVTGCAKTYVAQFAEDPQHRHVHFHVIPVPADNPDELRSYRIFARLGVPRDQQVPEERMNEISNAMAIALEARS
jgi:diadenosine tetraphosphate (Ap4A) HIT family hydrolase